MGGIVELLAGSADRWKIGIGVGASIGEVMGIIVELSAGSFAGWSVGVPI